MPRRQAEIVEDGVVGKKRELTDTSNTEKCLMLGELPNKLSHCLSLTKTAQIYIVSGGLGSPMILSTP